MLNNLKKEFQKAFGNEKENKEMTTKDADISAEKLEGVTQEVFAALQKEVAEKDTQLASLVNKVADLEKSLSAFADAKAALEKEIQDKRLEDRKNAIIKAVGTDKAEALLEHTSSLDDASFEVVVGAMAANLEKEAKTVAFKEIGVDAKADVEKTNAPTHFNKFIKKESK